jgi:hypothetical protein
MAKNRLIPKIDFKNPWIFFISTGLLFLLFLLKGRIFTLLGNCWNRLHPDCWSRWDSGLYLEIAEKGHTLFLCPDFPGAWCGTSGWAPLYPFIIRLFHGLFPGLSFAEWGMYLSNGFWWASLYWLYRLIRKSNWSNSLILSAFGLYLFMPGNVYFHAIFPISLLGFCFLGMLVYLQESQFWKAGIFGFFATLSYSIGFFLIPVLAFWMVENQIRRGGWKFERKLLLPQLPVLVLSALGITTWFVYDYWATGHWNALFLIQSKYGHRIDLPFRMLARHFEIMLNSKTPWEFAVELQNYFVWILVIYLVIQLYKMRATQTYWSLYSALLLMFWWIPYSGTEVSALYRQMAVLFPLILMIFPSIRAQSRWIILSILMLFTFPLGYLFIISVLV